MFFITGDTHRDFKRIETFCQKNKTSRDDVMIILGDASINFFGGISDVLVKEYLSSLPITFFCIHGNHEMRPLSVRYVYGGQTKKAYRLIPWHGGKVYQESLYPSILFAHDGDIYDFDGYSVLVCGGAYSPDKEYRLKHKLPWFPDEQPDKRIRNRVLKNIREYGNSVDIVMTHTIPKKFIAGLNLKPWPGLDQSTEEFLDTVEERLNYKKWYAGHFHMDKRIGNLQILFNKILPLTYV